MKSEELNMSEPLSDYWNRGYCQFLFLFCSALCLTGNYYAYDLPAALNLQLRELMGISGMEWQNQLGWLYAAYSLPNIFLPLLASKYVNKFGSKCTLVLLSSLVVAGQLLFVFGLRYRSFPIMLFGRLILGLGGESLGIAQARITCQWFQYDHLGLALAINLGMARIGSVLSSIISPYLATVVYAHDIHHGTTQAVLLSFAMCSLSWVCCVILALIDRAFSSPPVDIVVGVDPIVRKVHFQPNRLVDQPLLGGSLPYNYGSTKHFVSVRSLANQYWPDHYSRPHSPDPANRISFVSILSSSSQPPFKSQNDPNSFTNQSNTVQLNDIKLLNNCFWYVSILIALYYSAVIPYTNIASDFLQHYFLKGQPHIAGVYLAIPDLLSTLLVPIMASRFRGIRVRLWLAAMCGIGLGLAHYLLNSPSYKVDSLYLTIGLGLFYAIFASSIWSSIPYFVPEYLFPLAYALSTCLLNLALTISPLVVANVINTDPTFHLLGRYFTLLAALGTVLSFYLLYYVHCSEVMFVPTDLEREIADDFESVLEESDDYYSDPESNIYTRNFNTTNVFRSLKMDNSSDDIDSIRRAELDQSLRDYATPSSSLGFQSLGSDPTIRPWYVHRDGGKSQESLLPNSSNHLKASSGSVLLVPTARDGTSPGISPIPSPGTSPRFYGLPSTKEPGSPTKPINQRQTAPVIPKRKVIRHRSRLSIDANLNYSTKFSEDPNP